MKNILVTKNQCCGCSACQDVCPKNAITMVEDKEGLLYPVIDENKCIDCGMCCNVCPSINVKTKESLLKAYAAYNKNEKIRLKSSSGGIFTLIAEDILKKNGIVYGAAFDENFDVYELYADSRITLDTVQNKVVKKWIMAANPIYLSSKLPKIYYSEDTERIHDYDEIYNGTPTYFISTKQLNYWYYFAKAIVLPFKTNLIMLIWKNETEFSMLDSIMMATTYSYYQNEYVNLTCNNVAYHLRISDIYQIWHYLLLYASEDDEKTFNQTIRNVIFGISNLQITLYPLYSKITSSFIYFFSSFVLFSSIMFSSFLLTFVLTPCTL